MDINSFKKMVVLFYDYTSKIKDDEIVDFLILQLLTDNGYDFLIDFRVRNGTINDQDLTDLYLDLIRIKGFVQDEFYLNVDIAITKLLEKVDLGFNSKKATALSTGMSLITAKNNNNKKYELQFKIETDESQFLENMYIESTSFDKQI